MASIVQSLVQSLTRPEAAFSRSIGVQIQSVLEDALAVASHVARRLGLPFQDAEDAAQEGGIAVLVCPRPLATLAEASSYGKGAAVKALLTTARIRARRKIVPLELDGHALVDAAPEAAPGAREAADALAALMAASWISPIQRAYLGFLFEVGDSSSSRQEVAVRYAARKCGCCARTVRNSVRELHARARAELQGLK